MHCGGRVVCSSKWGMNGYRDAKRERKKKLNRVITRLSHPGGMARSCAPYFPIDRLPQDILAEVFVRCLPEVELWPYFYGAPTSKCVAPLLLCNVCSSWRELALSIPLLWQRLSLYFSSTTPRSRAEEIIAFTHRWINRSGVLPLTLSLHTVVPYNSQDDFRPLVEAVLNAFVHYDSRWEYFNFSSYGLFPVTFPQLGHMHYLRSFSLKGGLPDDWLQVSSCPRLTRLTWPHQFTKSFAPNLPWHQLTHVAVKNFLSPSEILLVISSCPKLTDFDVESCDDVEEQLPHGLVIVHNNLRKVKFTVPETFDQVFKRLKLPVLTDLSLSFESYQQYLYWELFRFLTRSKCKLDRLHFEDWEFSDKRLMNLFKHDSCVSITQLGLSNMVDSPTLTDRVLVALTDSPSADSDSADSDSADSDLLLPNLAHLHLDMCFGGSPGMLGFMILSRCESRDTEDQLQSVSITCQELDPADHDLITLSGERGLKVTFDIIEPDDIDDSD